MNNLKSFIVILTAIVCPAPAVVSGAAAQTGNSAKAAPTAKNQKQFIKTPSRQTAKSDGKILTKPAKPPANAAAPKTTLKISGKQKPAAKSEPSPEKSRSAAAKTAANSKEKSVREKVGERKIARATKPAPTIRVKSSSTAKATVKKSEKISGNRQIIVATTSARLRSAPDAGAETISTVNIGTVLTVSEETAAWSKVRLSAGRSGWISKTVVSNFDDDERGQIYRSIVAKYFKDDRLNFADAAQIFDFLKTAKGENGGETTDLKYKRLLALKAALAAIPSGESGQNPYKNFLAANAGETVYSEPSGEWLVRSDIIWELHAAHKDLPVGEEIAWIGAQNSLPGECEGYVNCHLYLLRVTGGEYLNFYPGGKYSRKALQNITAGLEPIAADAGSKSIYTAPADISDRAEFNRLLTELRAIVSKVPHVEKAQTIKQINQIGEGFR